MAAENDITFRIAVAADIPVIQDLSTRIWREHYPGIITLEQIEYMLKKMYASSVIRDEMSNKGYRYILVEDRGTPAGYIAYLHEPAKRSVMISKLYLLPALHGKSVGRKMLQFVRDDAARLGAVSVYLFVNKRNVKAIKAYERFGFVKAKEIVTDIGGGFEMDDYRMELDLRKR